MQSELSQFGLVGDALGVGNVIDSVVLVIIGIFTSLFFSRFDSMVSNNMLQQITLIALSVIIGMFSIIRAAVTSTVALELRAYSRDFWRLMMQVLQFLRHGALFLMTHLVSSAFINLWSDMQLSAAESFSVMWCTFVSIYFVIQLLKKRVE